MGENVNFETNQEESEKLMYCRRRKQARRNAVKLFKRQQPLFQEKNKQKIDMAYRVQIV